MYEKVASVLKPQSMEAVKQWLTLLAAGCLLRCSSSTQAVVRQKWELLTKIMMESASLQEWLHLMEIPIRFKRFKQIYCVSIDFTLFSGACSCGFEYRLSFSSSLITILRLSIIHLFYLLIFIVININIKSWPIWTVASGDNKQIILCWKMHGSEFRKTISFKTFPK